MCGDTSINRQISLPCWQNPPASKVAVAELVPMQRLTPSTPQLLCQHKHPWPLHMCWRGIDWAVATGFATRDRMPDISLYLQKFRHSMLAHRHAFIERGIKSGKPTVSSWLLAKTAMILHLPRVPRCPKNPPPQLLPSSQAQIKKSA
jgi:hypothetical protein